MMTTSPKSPEAPMETIPIQGTSLVVSRIALGTWAIGGWMWGEVEDETHVDGSRDRDAGR
jgi:aryl-alcohol dehydrogenase-like predicted oxidoreductase